MEVSVLNLAHHAFAWAVDVGVAVISFPAGAICRGPVNFQTMRSALIHEIAPLHGDRLDSFRYARVPDFIRERLRLAFLPHAQGKLQSAGICPRISARSAVE